MCAKNASWTTIALTIKMHEAARSGYLFHLSKGIYKNKSVCVLRLFEWLMTFEPHRKMGIGIIHTSIEYAVPSRQLMRRAQNKGGDWNIIPMPTLWKITSKPSIYSRHLSQQSCTRIESIERKREREITALTISKDMNTICLPVSIEKSPEARGSSGLLTCRTYRNPKN